MEVMVEVRYSGGDGSGESNSGDGNGESNGGDDI